MKKLCIYHSKCADGFAAAVVVRLAFGKENVDFFPGVHQDTPPNVDDRDVILVDFSYKKNVLLKMAKKAKSILILDHHKSAKEDLVNLPKNITVRFCMEKSGAVITWEHFFKQKDVPQLLLYIQDRDLWKFELDWTREIQACLFSYTYDFDTWERLLNEDPMSLVDDGIAIERKHYKEVMDYIKYGADTGTIAGYDVPIVNAPYFYSSDIGHILCEGHPFACCYWNTPGKIIFSLRSNKNGIDVSKIAEKFGGGGHKNASGFSIINKSTINI